MNDLKCIFDEIIPHIHYKYKGIDIIISDGFLIFKLAKCIYKFQLLNLTIAVIEDFIK